MGLGVSVVIPTYNRAGLLRRTLESLARQSADESLAFEVIVCDDGSSDETHSVIPHFADDLDIRYTWQPDRGHRVAAARNMGIALARHPITAMLDCGALASHGFIKGHADAHLTSPRNAEGGPLAVIGNTVGYRFDIDMAGGSTRSVLDSGNDRALELARNDAGFVDMRQEDAARLDEVLLPWRLFWTTNVSAPTETLRSVGGFDEDFEGWGAEDVELGYRLELAGAAFVWADDAWALELPQHRDRDANRVTNLRNMRLLLTKHQHVHTEIFVGARRLGLPIPEVISRFFAWQRLGACAEGAPWPVVRWDHASGVVEFDVVHAKTSPTGPMSATRGQLPTLGIQTPLASRSFETARFAPALAGLWHDWSALLLDEADRLAERVEVPVQLLDLDGRERTDGHRSSHA